MQHVLDMFDADVARLPAQSSTALRMASRVVPGTANILASGAIATLAFQQRAAGIKSSSGMSANGAPLRNAPGSRDQRNAVPVVASSLRPEAAYMAGDDNVERRNRCVQGRVESPSWPTSSQGRK